METVTPFYLQWIPLQDVLKRVHMLELPDEERHALTDSILTTIHYELLDALLSLIPENEHETLLNNMQQHSHAEKVLAPHDVSVEIVETVVRRRGEKIIKDIHIALTE